MKNNKEYIYILFFELEGEDEIFYIGRTNNPGRREKEHRQALSRGESTDKYHFIRKYLEPNGYEWKLNAIREIGEGEYSPDYERWYVIQYTRDGYILMNMRYGDAERPQEMTEQVKDMRSIRSVEDVRRDRIRRSEEKERRAFEKSEALRKEILEEKLI